MDDYDIMDAIKQYSKKKDLVTYMDGSHFSVSSFVHLVEEIVPIAEVSSTHIATQNIEPSNTPKNQKFYIHKLKLVPYYTPSILSVSPEDDSWDFDSEITFGDEKCYEHDVVRTLREMDENDELDLAISQSQAKRESALPKIEVQVASCEIFHYKRYSNRLSLDQEVDILMSCPGRSMTLEPLKATSKMCTQRDALDQCILKRQGTKYSLKTMRDHRDFPKLDSRPQDVKDLVKFIPYFGDKIGIMERSLVPRALVADKIRRRRRQNPETPFLDLRSKLERWCLVLKKTHRDDVSSNSERDKTLSMILKTDDEILQNKILLRTKHIEANQTLTKLMSQGYAILRLPSFNTIQSLAGLREDDPERMMILLKHCIVTYFEDNCLAKLPEELVDYYSSRDVVKMFTDQYMTDFKLEAAEKDSHR